MSNNSGPVFWSSDRVVDYDEAASTIAMRNVPRFGKTNEFYDLYTDDSSNYVQGLVFGFCIVIIPFFIWLLLLCMCKMCVPGDVCGFITGAPFTSPYDAGRGQYKRWKTHTCVTRTIFGVSAILVMISATVMVATGVGNLQETKNILSHTNNEINLILDETSNICDVLIDVGRIAREVREQLYFEIGDNDNNALCPGDESFGKYNPKGKELTKLAADATTALEGLGDFSEPELANVKVAFQDAQKKMVGFDDMVKDINRVGWLWAFIAIPLILLPSLLILGAFAAQLTFMNPSWVCLINWLLLPIFLLWLMLALISAAFIGVMATASADFCTGPTNGTPDSTVLRIVENSGYDPSSFIFESTRYYVNQCTIAAETDPLLFLRDYDKTVAESETGLKAFSDLVESISVSNLALVCNREYEPLQVLIGTMENILKEMRDSSGRALGILDCERVVPMYTNTVYDAICKSNVNGLSVVYWCLIFISIFGWIMITTRSSYLNSVIQKHDLPKQREETYDDEQQ